MRNGVRAASLAVLVVATTGCCVLSPVVSVCAPGGFEGRGGGGRGGGHGGGHGGGRHHLLGAAPQPVSSLAVVASVETRALASMYVASDADTDASPVER